MLGVEHQVGGIDVQPDTAVVSVEEPRYLNLLLQDYGKVQCRRKFDAVFDHESIAEVVALRLRVRSSRLDRQVWQVHGEQFRELLFELFERIVPLYASVDDVGVDMQAFDAVVVFGRNGELPGREHPALVFKTQGVNDYFAFDVVDVVAIEVAGNVETGCRFGILWREIQSPQSDVLPFGEDPYHGVGVEQINHADEVQFAIRVVDGENTIVIGIVVVATENNVAVGVILEIDMIDVSFDPAPQVSTAGLLVQVEFDVESHFAQKRLGGEKFSYFKTGGSQFAVEGEYVFSPSGQYVHVYIALYFTQFAIEKAVGI